MQKRQLNKILATLGLIILALLGNIFSLPLFYGVDFLFGSTFVMLAVALLGARAAILAATASGFYTLFLWAHPYALIIFMLEGLVVAHLYRRWIHNLVLADLVYWLLLGAPLVLLFYQGVLNLGWEAAGLMAIKQPLNGIFNALIAGVLGIVFQVLRKRHSNRVLDISRPRLANVFFHTLLLTLLLAGTGSLAHEGYNLRLQEETLISNTLTQQASFLVQQIESTPLANQSLRKQQLLKSQTSPDIGIALLKDEHTLVASQGQIESLNKYTEKLQLLEGKLVFLFPHSDAPTLQRWRQGRYQVTAPVRDVAGISSLILETSAAPVVDKVEQRRFNLFAQLAGLLLVGIAFSKLMASLLTRPLSKLETVSRSLSKQIGEGTLPDFPASHILEYSNLGYTLKEMGTSLQHSFSVLQKTQASLEEQVQTRTAELYHFKSSLDRISDCVFMFNPVNLQIFYANEALCQQIEYSQEQITKKHAYEITPEINEHAYRQLLKPLLNGEKTSLTYETDQIQKNGYKRHLEVFIQYMAHAGETPRFISTLRDISERHHNEAILAEMNQMLRLAADAAGVGVWDWNIVTGHLEWDSWMFKLYGMKPKDCKNTYEAWLACVHPDDVDKSNQEVQLALSGKKDFNIKFRIIKPNKKIHTIKSTAIVLRNKNGKAERMIGINYDISDRLQAEIALEENTKHTQAILDTIVDGIITISNRGIITSANPAAERIFGYTAAEMMNNNVKMLMPNPYRDNHDSYLRNYQTTKVPRVIGIGREVEGQKKDGSTFPMDLAVSEVTLQDETIYVGMVRDITERKRTESIKSQFVSTVSHELRTPLTAISGALGLIVGGVMDELPQHQQTEMIGIAYKNSQRLSVLINDLLDIEKMVAGKLHFDSQEHNLASLLEQALEANRAYGAERKVTFMLTEKRDDVMVWVDNQRLMQVMSNLLSNAVKYSPKKGKVCISIITTNDTVRVTVVDNGPGIPEDFKSRIFQKFSQADSSDTRQKGGTGLGLSITKELIERMGGSVGFDTKKTNGASFYFELPIYKINSKNIRSKTTQPNNPEILNIVILESQPGFTRFLSQQFRKSRFIVDIEHSEEKLIERLKKTSHNAVVLDLVNPTSESLKTCEKIRNCNELKSLPILLVSTNTQENCLVINSDICGFDWLGKPVNKQHLLHSVEKLINSAGKTHPRVLHVEDDSKLHMLIRTTVSKSYELNLATTISTARSSILDEDYDLIIIDSELPDGSGWALIPEIRAQSPQTKIIVLSEPKLNSNIIHEIQYALKNSLFTPKQLVTVLKNIRPRIANLTL